MCITGCPAAKGLAALQFLYVIARPLGRGNPFFGQLVYVRSACTEYGLPRRLRLLAMTSGVWNSVEIDTTPSHGCAMPAPCRGGMRDKGRKKLVPPFQGGGLQSSPGGCSFNHIAISSQHSYGRPHGAAPTFALQAFNFCCHCEAEGRGNPSLCWHCPSQTTSQSTDCHVGRKPSSQ